MKKLRDSFAALALHDPLGETVHMSLPLGLKIFIAITGVLVLIFGVMHHGRHGFYHPH